MRERGTKRSAAEFMQYRKPPPIGWPIVKHVPEVDLRVGRPHLDAVAPRDAMIRVLGQQLVRDRLGERRPTAAGIEFVAR